MAPLPYTLTFEGKNVSLILYLINFITHFWVYPDQIGLTLRADSDIGRKENAC